MGISSTIEAAPRILMKKVWKYVLLNPKCILYPIQNVFSFCSKPFCTQTILYFSDNLTSRADAPVWEGFLQEELLWVHQRIWSWQRGPRYVFLSFPNVWVITIRLLGWLCSILIVFVFLIYICQNRYHPITGSAVCHCPCHCLLYFSYVNINIS